MPHPSPWECDLKVAEILCYSAFSQTLWHDHTAHPEH